MRNVVPAQIALLLELSRGEGWGDDLRARLAKRTGGKVDLSRGSVVPALEALVGYGVIQEVRREPRRDLGGTPRVIYGLTAAGREAVEETLDTMRLVMGESGAAPAAGQAAAAEPEADEAPAPPERIVVLDEEEGSNDS